VWTVDRVRSQLQCLHAFLRSGVGSYVAHSIPPLQSQVGGQKNRTANRQQPPCMIDHTPMRERERVVIYWCARYVGGLVPIGNPVMQSTFGN
jgi:hypothetical protein